MLVNLDGTWEVGIDRRYDRTAIVPGLATDPKTPTAGTLWYRRRVRLPGGAWTHATLLLGGARFCPAVYVDGVGVSETEGGMAETVHPLPHPGVAPGATIRVEIALKSLDDVPAGDASRIPKADLWRSNVSSCLWDSVRLHLHGPTRIARLIPSPDLGDDAVTVRCELDHREAPRGRQVLSVEVMDEARTVLASGETTAGPCCRCRVALGGKLRRWSPEDPVCYTLRVRVRESARIIDEREITYGHRTFGIEGLGFRLNGEPLTVRAGTVVWHRWCRDPEARELAFDRDWFEANIVRRLRSHGANALRFHLGMPPESFLDLCDRRGLIVQAEWIFFHGMQADRASLRKQWRDWLDLCMRHPSVCIVHPWNETEGEELDTAFAALGHLVPEYPPMVVSHRDVIHVHKYWWSLFENVGVYYDSASQFPQPIMVDEFGGNYLDGDGDPGGYPSLRATFPRFLGPDHTRELRLRLLSDSNARVAEYWRRIGAAGFSPFCILGSPEDGSHHFLGPIREARPKPVWDALTAAYAPRSCSLDLWDRNFEPSRAVEVPLHLFNDTPEPGSINVEIRVVDESGGGTVWRAGLSRELAARGTGVVPVRIPMPSSVGRWRIEAEMVGEPCGVVHPIISCWRVRTMTPRVPEGLGKIAVPPEEKELRAFLRAAGIDMRDYERADVVLTGRRSWEAAAEGGEVRDRLADLLRRGAAVVMLDIGPRELGQGYPDDGDVGPLQGGRWIPEPQTTTVEPLPGLRVLFTEVPEPESCIHPAQEGGGLWWNLDQEATWLWNGLRGGLVVPARDMEPRGLSREALLRQWESRGADPRAIREGRCIAYELAGFYAFADRENEKTQRELREKVRFLVEDAPALAGCINPDAAIRAHDPGRQYAAGETGRARKLTPLARCGKDLARSPVIEIAFEHGRLILSQLLTAGRLAVGYGTEGHYGIRPDVAAQQFVLNLAGRAHDRVGRNVQAG